MRVLLVVRSARWLIDTPPQPQNDFAASSTGRLAPHES